MKKINSKILISWLLVLFWLGVINYFSCQPNLKSEFQPFWDLILRKLAHMSEFFVLAFLLFSAYSNQKINKGPALVLALIGALATAGLDEWHQGFVAGRTASPLDVAIDFTGAAAFGILKQLERKNYLKKIF